MLGFAGGSALLAQKPARSSTGENTFPRWSHHGRLIVFSSDRDGDHEIYVMGADGAKTSRLTHSSGRDAHLDDNAKWRICIMRPDGSGLRVITPGEANDQVPNWSPDGARLIFYSDRGGKNQVYSMNPAGGDVRRLTTTRATERMAVWSPAGRQLAFSSERDGPGDLYLLNADGSGLSRIGRQGTGSQGG